MDGKPSGSRNLHQTQTKHRTPLQESSPAGLNLQLATVRSPTQECVKNNLVGGFNPFENYARRIGSFLWVGVKIKNVMHGAWFIMHRSTIIVF